MNKSPHAKRQFYAQPQIASKYDEQRFGGASGAWVNARELEVALALLPAFHRALDLGCGTGRLTRLLAARGETIGVDSSRAMLAQARDGDALSLVQGDAFQLPFANASFEVVVALRLVFHFAEIDTLLSKIARVVAGGGAVVFDTYLWSPRAWLPLDAANWGGGVFAHPPAQIDQAARRAGLQVAAQVPCFLFSPYVYRRLPLAVVRALARVESQVPARLRARVFWKLVKT
jgi:SAM-dependent methyltransferase